MKFYSVFIYWSFLKNLFLYQCCCLDIYFSVWKLFLSIFFSLYRSFIFIFSVTLPFLRHLFRCVGVASWAILSPYHCLFLGVFFRCVGVDSWAPFFSVYRAVSLVLFPLCGGRFFAIFFSVKEPFLGHLYLCVCGLKLWQLFLSVPFPSHLFFYVRGPLLR